MPFETSSPFETIILVIFPLLEAGISIAAFSDSKTIKGSSIFTWSPSFTHISITSRLSASPRSGILITFFNLKLPKDENLMVAHLIFYKFLVTHL